MRDDRLPFADDAPSQPALRRLRRHLGAPRVAIALTAVGLLVALLDAFGLSEVMRLPARVVYWLVIAWTTYAAGSWVGYVLGEPLRRRGWPRAAVWLCEGLAIGAAVLAIVSAINLVLFGPAAMGGILSLAPTALAMSLVIAVALDLATVPEVPEARGTAAPRPALIDRLPVAARGRLLSLSAEDHYTRVRTVRGEGLLLLRLGDAIREARPERGLQVHRSHWVALEAVTRVERRKDRAILHLADGVEIPASRGYLPALRDAGLLPGPADRKANT